MPKIAIATSRDWPHLAPEERLLLGPLSERGIVAVPAVWDDARIEWSKFDGVLIRSCWDYSERLGEFLAWIERVERLGVAMWNSAETVRQNVDKRYLRSLEAAGIDIVPTEWVEAAAGIELQKILESRGWREVVVKPVISAGARNTWRFGRGEMSTYQPRVAELAARVPIMIQPFLPEIETDGEWSLIFFGGDYSHAVVKRPAAGDFRVQEEHGGASTLVEAPGWLIEQSRKGLRASVAESLYARVDGVVCGERFLLMEMELTEPQLFLTTNPPTAQRFADTIAYTLKPFQPLSEARRDVLF